MKKLLLSFGAVVLLAAGAQAQTSYGLKAGVNLGKYSSVPSAFEDMQKNNLSFYVTGYADIPVASQFSIQPGVSLQGKGAKYEGESANANGKLTQNVMSIEVPVNAVYYIPAGAGNVFLGAGPYVGFNISGKLKASGDWGEIFDGSAERDLSFSGDDKDMNLIDAGVNFLGGYKFNNGFLINAGYGLGLSNLNPNDGDKLSNRVLSFGVGFQF